MLEQSFEEYSKFRQGEALSISQWHPDFNLVIKGESFLKSQFQHKAQVTLHTRFSEGLPVKRVNVSNLANQSIEDRIRTFFTGLSPDYFKRGTIAASYYDFYDLCRESQIPFVMVAGVCTYYYWGVYPLYDIDVVVPRVSDLDTLAQKVGKKVNYNSKTKIGVMSYLDLGDVDVLSDLVLFSPPGLGVTERPFTFNELTEDAQVVDFFGVSSTMTSPEMTTLMKLYLGRFGQDVWGIPKDDYEDGWGTFVSQNLDLSSLRKRAEKMGISEKLELAERIAREIYGLKFIS